jgi:hypothetical protein
MNILGEFLRKRYKKVYIKAYDKHKKMPKEERKFEYAYLEANLKIIPIFSTLFSIASYIFNIIFNVINPSLFIILICAFLLFQIHSIMYTSLRIDILKEIDNKSNYYLKARRYGIS